MILAGCGVYSYAKTKNTQTIKITEAQYGYVSLYVTKFTYKDHTYLRFTQSDKEMTIIHDPDCQCNKK